MDIDLSMVDELNQGIQISECHVLENDHWMLAWCTL